MTVASPGKHLPPESGLSEEIFEPALEPVPPLESPPEPGPDESLTQHPVEQHSFGRRQHVVDEHTSKPVDCPLHVVIVLLQHFLKPPLTQHFSGFTQHLVVLQLSYCEEPSQVVCRGVTLVRLRERMSN